MVQDATGQWKCLVHTSGEWATARAMGASIPCQIPQPPLVRRELAKGPMSTGMAQILAQDPDPTVRRALAANKATPPSALALLSKDTMEHVRMAVACNPGAPASVLRSMVQTETSRVIMVALAGHPNMPEAELRAMARDPDLMKSVAANPGAPPDLFMWLVGKMQDAFRYANQSGPNPELDLPGGMLGRVLAWDTVNLAEGVAASPQAPPEVLGHLAAAPSPGVRLAVAGNEAAPSAALSDLAADSESDVAIRAINNPQTPLDAIRRAAHHRRSPMLVVGELFHQWGTRDPVERLAVQQTPRRAARHILRERDTLTKRV